MNEEILTLARELSQPVAGIQTEGIYLLFDHGVCVYIGTSAFCEGRVFAHMREAEKTFDSYTIIRYEVGSLLRRRAEREMIRIFKPVYNKPTYGEALRAAKQKFLSTSPHNC